MQSIGRGASLRTFPCRVLFKKLNHGMVSRKGGTAVTALGPSSTPATRSCSTAKARYGEAHYRVVDLRSDAATKPGPAMCQAMVEAAVRGDLIEDDQTVNELQEMAADMFGMEAALFVPTGTMGNLIAVMVHCRERGDEMIVGDLSHLHIYEQGGSAQLAGVHTTTVTTLPDGTFDLEQLESKIRHNPHNPCFTCSRLICLENTHNIQGGRVLPLTFLQEVRALADRYGLSVHMDGARVMNAAVAQGVSLHTILQHTHSVSACLNKGLGAPVGAVLAGPRDFISRAVRCRKALGGLIHQAGILAAAGKHSLLDMGGSMEEDHRNARTFAQSLLDCDTLFAVDTAAVESNIVRFYLKEPSLSPTEFVARMGQVGEGEEAALGQGIQVLLYPFFGKFVRAVWHYGISLEDTQLATQKMQFVASQYLQKKARAQ
ncbi:probable low-specificity L-threonine aldolase 2 [Scophthalmus maximus]|uniref:probable low-specificity L-threonine aldolase 2 n=1 Tax=Scophthalmus maximus TaxID=52904 RepID=UPI001FA93691|nr:probable low-specificity L-threonine aldolase 2 [Scophthalmus maximus]